jgi:hypothetical protein
VQINVNGRADLAITVRKLAIVCILPTPCHSFCLHNRKPRSAALKIAHLKLRVNHEHRPRLDMMTQVERSEMDWREPEQRQNLYANP